MTCPIATKPGAGSPAPGPEEPPDEQLLEQFLGGDDLECQDAFRAMVVRHGPSLLAICRHVLNGDHDAEDAVQATFLSLARKGASISDRRALSGWLREVAYRTALRSRTRASRRRQVERQAMAMAAARLSTGGQHEIVSLGEPQPVLDEEVVRLPEKYRVPVILS